MIRRQNIENSKNQERPRQLIQTRIIVRPTSKNTQNIYKSI